MQTRQSLLKGDRPSCPVSPRGTLLIGPQPLEPFGLGSAFGAGHCCASFVTGEFMVTPISHRQPNQPTQGQFRD